jgi:hypothetical protein
MQDRARGTAEVPAISLLSLQIDHLSETTKLGSNSGTCILETPVNTKLNCVVGPVPIPLASPSNIVEGGPTSSTGLEIQRSASPVINVDPSAPIMDVMSKRKASDPELEAYLSKKPKVSPISFSNLDSTHTNSNSGKIKYVFKKRSPASRERSKDVDSKLDPISESLSIQMAEVAGLIMPPPPP